MLVLQVPIFLWEERTQGWMVTNIFLKMCFGWHNESGLSPVDSAFAFSDGNSG